MKMTPDEKEFFNYMISLHVEEGGYSQKEAEHNAQFDVRSRRSVGNHPWRDNKSPRS